MGGEVYRARDPRLGRDVALKVLPAESSDPDRVHRFQQEARAVAALKHPHILAIHDVGSHEGQPYIVLELLEGETLRQRLSHGPLPVSKAVEFGVQVCQGLAARGSPSTSLPASDAIPWSEASRGTYRRPGWSCSRPSGSV